VIIELSLRSLVRRRSRTLLALTGIAISAALLLDMSMLASGLTKSFGELMRSQGYGLRVTPRGTLPFDSEAGIGGAAEARARIEALPGVRSVAPALGAQLYLVRGDSAGESLFSVGIDPSAQMLYLLISGRDPGPGEVVVSRPLAEAFHLQPEQSEIALGVELDISLGRPREAARYRVSGVGDFLYDFAGQRSIAMPLAEVQRLTGRPDEVSLFAVAAAGGADEAAVARRIEDALPQVTAYSNSELMRAMDQRLLYFRQMATILGSVALVVTALLVSTIIAIGVRERFGEIAALRAIGVARRRLLTGIVMEGLALAGVGCVLGLPLGLWMAGRLDRILMAFPGLPARLSFFVFDPLRVTAALAVVIACGALSGLIPGAAALRAPLSQALREEGE
jgi:putative ABC transport system permease protein